MNTYPSYKDSGVEWIGEIPSGWVVKPLKYVSDNNLNSLGNSTDPEYKLNYIEISDVNSLGTFEKPTQYTFSKSPSRCRRIVKKNDIIISTVRTYLKSIGFIKEEVKDLICSTGFCVITPYKKVILPDILFYMVRMESFISTVISLSEGVSYPSINSDKLVGVKILIPPLQEQQQIVDYLDYKTSKIDTLIEKTEQKIELLKEQRTSLINTTVTKGLNPNVEMKDSGVEWIGEIPSGWVVKPLKYVSDNNLNSLGNSTDPEYKLNYIEISDVNSLGTFEKPTQYTFSKSPSRCRRIVKKNDIIISTVRTYLKSIGFIKEEVKDLICSTGFCVITPYKKVILPDILFYMVRMESFISTVISLSEGVSYPSINSDKLVGVKILIPPLQEQQQIVDYLDIETSKIDKLVNIESKRIDLLKEYRQSLISEVVTGKVDVRDEVLV